MLIQSQKSLKAQLLIYTDYFIAFVALLVLCGEAYFIPEALENPSAKELLSLAQYQINVFLFLAAFRSIYRSNREQIKAVQIYADHIVFVRFFQ